MEMANDIFIVLMTDSQLQTAFKQLNMNIKSDSSEGMIKDGILTKFCERTRD